MKPPPDVPNPRSPEARSSFQEVVPLLVILVVAVFFLSTIRSGHRWRDDFSMYILHARNIVQGLDYQDTGYLYDPFLSVIGPQAYPPVFPLALAPVYAVFGLDLAPMKVVVIVFFILFLVVFYRAFRPELSSGAMAAALSALGFNPAIWDMKDDILSDLPFLFFTYLTLFTIQQFTARQGSGKERFLQAVVVGLLAYLSFGTRNAGIVLIPALFLFDLWHHKRPTLFPWIAAVVFSCGWFLQNQVVSTTGSYFDQFNLLPRTVYFNLVNYAEAMLSFWQNGYSQFVQICLFAVLLGLAILGAVVRMRSGVTIYELYALLYMVLILLWPANQGVRFLVPIIPLWILYVFTAVQWVGRWKLVHFQKASRWVLVCLTLWVVISYVGTYTRMDFGSIPGGVEKEESRQLFEFIQQNTSPDDVFLFSRPRALALYTDRSASGYSELENEQFNLNFAASKGVDYFIVGPDDEYLRLLVKRYPERFKLAYTNPDFSMYQFSIP